MNVVLTGTATPYISATQQAARATQAASRQIETSMRAATNSSSAALQNMARTAEAQGARAAASLNRTASVTESQMRRVGTSGAASLNQVGAGAARAATDVASVGSAAAAAAATTARQFTGAGGAVTRVSAAARAASAADAGRLASAWSSAAAAIGGGMRFAATTVGTSMMEIANTSTKSLKAAQAASLGLVAVFGLAAAAAARFDKAMSEVRAVTGGSADDMKALSTAALEAGRATVYSATQAANAEAELARAGISTADIIGGALKGSLDLAASGQLELGESAIISAQAMNAFKLKGSDVGHIADVISAGAGKSATNVHHMGMAFRQAALLSSQTGLSLEQTVGTLSMFAQNALTGSDAGTSLKVMLQRLVPQSKEAKAAMDAIGFSAYDASGNFIGLSALADVMKSSFSKLTPEARNAAMATIFGSDAVRAATILYKAGAEGVDQWVSAVNDTGYATRVAATMTDNLSGDLERLKGALETALISSGSSGNKVLREMAQALSGVVNWYNQLSPSVQSNVTILAGLIGILGLVGSSLLLMLPRIMAVRTELVALGVTAARVRGAMMGLGGLTVILATLGAIAVGIGKLTERFRAAPPEVNRLAESLVDFAQQGKVSGEMARIFGKDLDKVGEAAARIAHPDALDRMEDFFSTFDPNADAGPSLEAAREKIKSLDEALAGLVSGGATEEAAANFERLAAEAEKHGTSSEKLLSILPRYDSALAATSTQSKLAAGSQKELGDSAEMTADQIADTRSAADKLKDSLAGLNGVAISAAEKEISFRASLQDLSDTVKESGHSLDVTSESGRKVKSSFLDAAQAAMAHAQAISEQTGSVEKGNAALEQDIAVLKRQMLAAGFSTKAVEELIGAYAQVPTQVVTDIKAETDKAVSDLQRVQGEILKTNGKQITIDALTAQAEKNLRDLGFNVVRLPDGHVTVSIPTGPPSAAIDTIQGRINNMSGTQIGVGVYLRATASDRDANGVPDLIQAQRRDGGLIGYASGGPIRGYPTGGSVRGPGSGTSDSILARVSNGEYVIKAASVRQYGVPFLNELNSGRLQAAGYAARPAARFGSGGSGGQPVQQITKHYTIVMNGSKQSSAEQAAEIQRHLQFVG
ncbi:phage tail tape measure protein [Streptomyces sp. NPDC006544]|uniref:phage tail tape measure protein n=1 Tax=Streptomyces sp. NPDC006544 TaxID=3154583 RepID=UPI0033A7CEC3